MTASALILGSAQDGGTPQVGTWDPETAERSASSVAIIDEDGAVLLFDASPDLRTQYRTLAAHLAGAPLLDGVFITHGHMGHYAGLVHFGKEAAATTDLPLFASASVLSFLTANEPWATLFTDNRLVAVEMNDLEARIGAISVVAIPVPHRAEYTDTVGFSIALDDTPWLLYVPDIDGWDVWAEAEETIAAHDVAIIDATFTSLNELPHRDIARIKHPLVGDTISRFSHMTSATSIILSHINHSNPLGIPGSAISEEARSLGFIVAHDGMVITHG